ncbi:MAG: hypothetical protein R2860_11220 [Desulfobacterales bacterium]
MAGKDDAGVRAACLNPCTIKMKVGIQEAVFQRKGVSVQVPGKVALTPDTVTCNMEPETIITDLAHGLWVPALGKI